MILKFLQRGARNRVQGIGGLSNVTVCERLSRSTEFRVYPSPGGIVAIATGTCRPRMMATRLLVNDAVALAGEDIGGLCQRIDVGGLLSSGPDPPSDRAPAESGPGPAP